LCGAFFTCTYFWLVSLFEKGEIIMENLGSGENVELYDGEDRTGIWWRVIVMGALMGTILFYVVFWSLFLILQEGPFEDNGSQISSSLQKLNRLNELMNKAGIEPTKKVIGIGILLGIGIFILTIGLSMIFSNFVYCLFRWNVLILLLVGVSTFLVMYFLFVPEDIKSSLCVSFAATLVVITIKTLIFYFGRWSIVSWS